MQTSSFKPEHATPSRTTNTYSTNSSTSTTNAKSPTFHHHHHNNDNDDLSAFEHISPTKALLQSRLNNDITSLTAWLETLHTSGPVPRHLLNWRDEVQHMSQFNLGIVRPGAVVAPGGGADDSSGKVLEALKALKQANLLADHLRTLVHEAKVEGVEEVQRKRAHMLRQREEKTPSRVCMDQIYASLGDDGKAAVEELESAAVLLNLSMADEARGGGSIGVSDLMGFYSRQVLGQAHRRCVLDDQIERLRSLLQCIWVVPGEAAAAVSPKVQNDALRRVDTRTSVAVGDTNSIEGFRRNENLQAETAGLMRDTKQINLKILEYQDRVTGLHRQLSKLRVDSISLEDLLVARKQVEERSSNIEELEQRIGQFHGLAPDLSASRNEIKRATMELERFKRKREDLFGRISNVER